MLPIIRPVVDTHFFGKYVRGKTAAGWENVKGIFNERGEFIVSRDNGT